jgi:hypothetical protein
MNLFSMENLKEVLNSSAALQQHRAFLISECILTFALCYQQQQRISHDVIK